VEVNPTFSLIGGSARVPPVISYLCRSVKTATQLIRNDAGTIESSFEMCYFQHSPYVSFCLP